MLAGPKAWELQIRGLGRSVTAQPTHLHLGNTFWLMSVSSHLHLAAKNECVVHASRLGSFHSQWREGPYASQITSNTILRDIGMGVSTAVQVSGASVFHLSWHWDINLSLATVTVETDTAYAKSYPAWTSTYKNVGVACFYLVYILRLIKEKKFLQLKRINMTKLYKIQTSSEPWTRIELRVSAQENTETTEGLSVVTIQISLHISFWESVSVTYFLVVSFLLLPKWQLKKIVMKQYERLLRFNVMLSSRQWYKYWRKQQQHCLS